MKKLHIFGMMALALAGFTACQPDEDPKIGTATEFVLNTPPMADHTYELTPDGVLQLTCSQPNWGLALAPSYTVDVSLTPEFEVNDEGEPQYESIISGYGATLDIKESDLSKAVLKLLGINTYEEFPEAGVPETPIYIRAIATLPSVKPEMSNTIELKGVVPYNPYREGGAVIWLVGNPSSWDIDPGNPGTLTETSKDSKVFVGNFTFNSNQYFRFYLNMDNGYGEDNELPSFGPTGKDGENTEITIGEEPLYCAAVAGKGNWHTPDGMGETKATVIVDLRAFDEKDPTDQDSRIVVSFVKSDEADINNVPHLFAVGSFSAWAVADPAAADIYENYRLYDFAGAGTYTGLFWVPTGQAQFRFYKELGNWGAEGASIGADKATAEGEDGDSALFSFTNGLFSGTAIEAQENWKFENWSEGYMLMQVDPTAGTVKYSSVALQANGPQVIE